MKIKIAEAAKQVLYELELFVESKNTKGAGKRFKKRFVENVKSHLQNPIHLDCKNEALKAKKLKCFFINHWVIAYKIESNQIVIYVIIHGSLLS
ncbi:MAG: hypothetical protein RIQ33_1848 [Bacteroidota bacterium]